MLDVVVRLRGDFTPFSDTPSHIRVARGGSGANLALALRACAHRVGYVAAVGRDAAGRIFEEALRDADVATHLYSSDRPTGTVVSLVEPDGQRSMLSDRGANSTLDAAHVDAVLDLPFDHVHVSGYLLFDPSLRAIGTRALERAIERGVTSSVDVCSVGPLIRTTPRVFFEAAGSATTLLANEAEATALTACADAELALEALAERFAEVVVTRGAKGADGARGEQRFHADARALKVLDTTGAGDAAAGAYLGARLNGAAPLVALESAMVAAARVVGGLGPLG